MRSTVKFRSGHVALLLIDLQEEQRSDPLYAAADFGSVLANARRLLLAARRHKVPVFHVAYRRDFALRPPRPFEPGAANGAPLFSQKDSPSSEICREVAPGKGETVICKNDASAFDEGSLQARLAKLQIEWLVVAGVWTESCVAASVRDAMAAGMRVLLVKDACGSGSAAIHQTGILNLANRLYGGAVADVTRAEALMGGAEAVVWTTDRPVPILYSLQAAVKYYESL
jgi:nicotinamidase-related amidase